MQRDITDGARGPLEGHMLDVELGGLNVCLRDERGWMAAATRRETHFPGAVQSESSLCDSGIASAPRMVLLLALSSQNEDMLRKLMHVEEATGADIRALPIWQWR